MATDRQKRIREHLAKSSGGLDFERSPQNYQPSTASAMPSSRKKNLIEHLARSSGNYNLNSGSKQERKERIMNHIRLTRG